MGSFANTLFRIMLGWLQGIVSAIWNLFTSEKGGSFLEWIGKHWIILAAVLCIIGLAVDLGVYLIRWKPFKVWKSFFTRNRGVPQEQFAENGAPYSGDAVTAEKSFYFSKRTETREREPEDPAQPDLSQWETPEKLPAPEPKPAEIRKSTAINAGYDVPDDSPYRRPRQQASYDGDSTAYRNEQKDEPVNLQPRKRRRINVTELFSNPEEELYAIDAPQEVIDSRKAYHDPVYPRDWKKGRDDSK